jgi:hypothetical protein
MPGPVFGEHVSLSFLPAAGRPAYLSTGGYGILANESSNARLDAPHREPWLMSV